MASLQPVGTAPATAPANTQLHNIQRPQSHAVSTLTRASEDKSDGFIVTAFKWVISLFKKIFCCSSSKAETPLAPASEEESQEVGRLEQIAQLLKEDSDELELKPVTQDFISNLASQFFHKSDHTFALSALLRTFIDDTEFHGTVQYHVEETEEGHSLFFKVEGEGKERAYKMFSKCIQFWDIEKGQPPLSENEYEGGPLLSVIDYIVEEGKNCYTPVFECDGCFKTYARYDCTGDNFKSRIRDLSGELTFIGAVENLSFRIGYESRSVKSLQKALRKVAQIARESSFEVVDGDGRWGQKLVITFEGLGSQEFLNASDLFNDIDREALARFYSFETHEIRKDQDQALKVYISQNFYEFRADFLGKDYEPLSEEESEEESEEDDDWLSGLG